MDDPQEAVINKVTTLYRMFDADGQLLYVGITGRLLKRCARHRNDKPWWADVVDVKLTHFPNWEDAYRAEAEAIADEKPIYNVQRKIRIVPPWQETPREEVPPQPSSVRRESPVIFPIRETVIVFGGNQFSDMDL